MYDAVKKIKPKSSIENAYIFPILIAIVLSVVTAVIASVILSLSAVYLSLPPSVMPLASILTVSLSSFMGGYTVAKMLRKKGMILDHARKVLWATIRYYLTVPPSTVVI